MSVVVEHVDAAGTVFRHDVGDVIVAVRVTVVDVASKVNNLLKLSL